MMDQMHRFRARPHPALSRGLIITATYFLLLALLSAAATPQQYDLRVGEVAPITITATKDVEDTIATQRLVSAAMAAVSPSYVADSSALGRVLDALDGDFSALSAMKSGDASQSAQSLAASLSQELGIEVAETEVQAVLDADGAGFSALLTRVRRLVREELNSNVTEGQEKDAAERIRRALATDGYDSSLVSLMGRIVSQHIEPSMVLDEEATELNRQKAAASVDPVIYKQGQNIVRSGEVVTSSQYELLSSLGLLMENKIDFALYAGLAVALALLLGALYAFLFVFEGATMLDNRNLLLLSTILFLVAALCLATHMVSIFFMPVALSAMLVGVLLKPRIGFIANLALAILCVMMTATSTQGATSLLFIILSSVSAACICNSIQKRRQSRLITLLCGLVTSACNMAAVLSAMLINNASMAKVYPALGFAAAGGLLTGVLCIGLQPALEWLFNLMTQTKLLELSNPNQPLLRRLLLEAPGTYHHSIIVANLAEAGAAAIGANGLLARVGAYYHDVGKLKRPLYFKENQMGDNPHDRTDPAVSSAILTAHTKDGVLMARKYRIPQPVLDIIEQHHGDTPTLYFYDRAKKQNPNAQISIDDFRYSGPRPQSAEAAVVMLADTVEAAARAAGESDPAKTELLLRKLIRAKMDDGQLGDSPLTMRDLEKICAAFHTVLTGIYHERVEYPAMEPIPPRPLVTEAEAKAEKEQKEEVHAH